jgi:hypothetical protein
MAVKPLNALVGQNHHRRLAPDLAIAEDTVSNAMYQTSTGIDASGALTTVLSLTGKWAIDNIYVQNLVSSDMDQYKLTVDGVVIWNEDGLISNPTAWPFIGQVDGDNGIQGIQCDSSFLLEMEMNTDTSIDIFYIVRPVL